MRDDIIEKMAEARTIDTYEMNNILCGKPRCDAEQCVEYRRLCDEPDDILPVAPEKRVLVLPTDAAARNEYPLWDGLFAYFPNALAEIARLSFISNEQHNPGEPLHWATGKSTDHANKIVKHLLDHGHMDTDGTRHSTKLGWRTLALLEEELVAAGAPRGRNVY